MRLVPFMIVAIVLSLGVGVVSYRIEASLSAALVKGVVALVVLQVAYFVFLAIAGTARRK